MELLFKDYIARKVVDYYSANPPVQEQILHTQAVVAYTRLIAVGEGFDAEATERIETAAWLHDVGCPNARRLYGSSLPAHQMREGKLLVEQWLAEETRVSDAERQWLADVVGTHHTLRPMMELNALPLFEADIIVNMWEGYYKPNTAQHQYDSLMHTETGRSLFSQFFLGENAFK